MSKAKIVLLSVFLGLLAIQVFQGFKEVNAAAISVTVPFGTAVADSALDGFPATGAWGDANSYTVDLENGASSLYGTATIYFKHNGTDIFIRIDGNIDVPWTSSSGNHFWLGFQIDPVGVTGHHRTTQDTIFFGETSYSGVSYPLSPIDTFGGGRPPTKDTTQDAFGLARYSETVAPFDFTAEWRKKLNTGDGQDVALVANGVTTYSFYVTTDSDGGGSSGGTLDHSVVTTDNTMKLAPAPAPPVPEFPLGLSIIMLFIPALPIAYLWRLRQKERD